MMDEKREEKVSEGVNLTRFEMTQLSNLCPSSAEEAKSLVKSLEHKIAVTLVLYKYACLPCLPDPPHGRMMTSSSY